MERRFTHMETGITVTNMVNPKSYCNTGSGAVIPAVIVEKSTDFKEIFPIGYLSLQGVLLDLSSGAGEWPFSIHEERAQHGDHPIWDKEHLKQLNARPERVREVRTAISEDTKDRYREEGWIAARSGIRWIIIHNDAKFDTFKEWREEEQRLANLKLTADYRTELTKECEDCQHTFSTKDENQKYCNPCLFKFQQLSSKAVS